MASKTGSKADKQGTGEGKWWKRVFNAIWKYLFARRKPEKERMEDSRFVVFIKWLVRTIIKVLVLVAIAMGFAVVTLFGVQSVSPTFFGLVEGARPVANQVEGLLTVLVAYLTLLIATGSIFGYIFIKDSSIVEAKKVAKKAAEDIFNQEAERIVEKIAKDLADERDAEEEEADAAKQAKQPGVADSIGESFAYHIVNTNSRYDTKAYKHMMDNKRASAFWDKKQVIYSINEGDHIFLYHSGEGIVAGGIASSPMRGLESDTPYGTEEVYVELSKFKNISGKPLSYNEICDIAGDYRPAVVSTRARVRRSAGDKIWKALQKRWDELQKSPKAE